MQSQPMMMQRKQSVHLSDSDGSFNGHSRSSSSDTDDSQPSQKLPTNRSTKRSKTSKPQKESKKVVQFHTFEAKNLDAARDCLIAEFHALHGGICLPTVRNSRNGYVAVHCRKCGDSASASVCGGTTWRTSVRSKATKCTFGQPSVPVSAMSVSGSTCTIPASSTLVVCSFCSDDIPAQDAIPCQMGLHRYCSDCFGNHVNNLCENTAQFFENDCAVFCVTCKESKVTSNFNMQEFVSRWVGVHLIILFEFFMQSFRLSKKHYERYVSAVSEKRVLDALKLAEKNKVDTDDVVQMALHFLFKPDACPNPKCKTPYEHSGDCASMTCDKCHSKFCLYCQKIITAIGAPGRHHGDELSGIAHNHVFNCPKRPTRDAILSQTCLYPTGLGESNGSFVQAFFMTRKLDALKVQMQHWSIEDCKRLLLHKQFQELLVELKTKQTSFRRSYPDKPQLLRFAFHRVIGIDLKFDFDAAITNAWWFSEYDDLESAPVAGGVAARPDPTPVAGGVAARPARFPHHQQLATLVSMGFDPLAAEQALEASGGNVERCLEFFL